jgi:hypothetical protein
VFYLVNATGCTLFEVNGTLCVLYFLVNDTLGVLYLWLMAFACTLFVVKGNVCTLFVVNGNLCVLYLW